MNTLAYLHPRVKSAFFHKDVTLATIPTLWLFSHDGKVRILNFNSRCASRMKIRKTVFWTTSRFVIWDAHLKSWSRGVFELCISQITQRNRCMNAMTSKSCFGGRSYCDLLTTSAYIPRAAYVQKHRKCELHACLIGRVPKHSSPAGMQNPKFGRSCVHCIIQISQLLRSCVHCVIQNAHFELKLKYALCRRVKTVYVMQVEWDITQVVKKIMFIIRKQKIILLMLKVLGKSVGLCKTSKIKDQLYTSFLVYEWRIICENFNPNGLILAEIWMKI